MTMRYLAVMSDMTMRYITVISDMTVVYLPAMAGCAKRPVKEVGHDREISHGHVAHVREISHGHVRVGHLITHNHVNHFLQLSVVFFFFMFLNVHRSVYVLFLNQPAGRERTHDITCDTRNIQLRLLTHEKTTPNIRP
jgi:hypothetical protein